MKMKKPNTRKGFVVLAVGVFICVLSQAQKPNYFNRYQGLCDSLEEVYRVPSALMMAVAYHESGGGTSRNAKLLNNHFGIVGKNNLLKTHGIKSKYRAFASDTAGYVAFCKLVQSKKFYVNYTLTTPVSKWVYSLWKTGYCPSETWPKKVNYIINNYKLL
jgi:Bax protein